MGESRGFLEWARHSAAKRDKSVRVGDFKEFIGIREVADSKRQGARCMDCGVPFCMQGCPLGNQIPDWNDLIFRGRWRAAWVALRSTNNFPEFTGRLCPAPCEAACVLNINQDPVTIEQIEKEIIERAFTEGWVVAEPPRARTGKRVAVVGSGPAGLAAAAQLNKAGHTVTVFERADKIGGLLRYGIPDFKMEKWVIDRRLTLMEAEGVRFETGADVGDALSWSELKVSHDAVVIAIGAMRPRDLRVPGRDASGVHFAMDYLEQQNRVVDALPYEGERLDVAGKKVIILGGGDTGSDCLGTAHRQGAASVMQLELMPAPPETRAAGNPWPQWPMTFRTSSSQEEGGARSFGLKTTKLIEKGGQLVALEAVHISIETDDDGRTKLVDLPDSTITVPVDVLLLAMGFTGPVLDTLTDDLGVALDPRGNIATDDNYATSVEGVYAAGDAKRGASLIVWAIAEGREAARAVDSYLQSGARSSLPTRGLDQPFGGR